MEHTEADKLPSVFDYKEISVFLTEFHQAKKRHNPYWSYRVWARMLGVRSHSLLAMVTNGTRKPSSAFLFALGRFLNMSDTEFNHLKKMAEKNYREEQKKK